MKIMVKTASDIHYNRFEATLSQAIAELKGPLFRTNIDPEILWNGYLMGIRADERQHYNCKCCKQFIKNYGGLAKLVDGKLLRSALWNKENYPMFFYDSLDNMVTAVEAAGISGVFVNDKQVWGTPKTGEWSHMAGAPLIKPFSDELKTAHQRECEINQDFELLSKSAGIYSYEVAQTVLKVLRSEAVDNAKKFTPNAEWFEGVLLALKTLGRNNVYRTRLLWHFAATAPIGWCHLTSSMLSTLFVAVKAGKTFEQIKGEWDAKAAPTQYRRTQAPPTEGQIAQANKLIEVLGVQRSLERRYAKLREVEALWLPPVPMSASQCLRSSGFFDHLAPKPPKVSSLELPTRTMTWNLFASTVLPGASSIEAKMPYNGAFYGLVAPVHPDAPKILQWDNQISWYMYDMGTPPARWSLMAGTWVKVNAVCSQPNHWGGRIDNQIQGAMFVLEGCRPAKDHPGGMFFTEDLKSQYHQIRDTLEEYVKRAQLVGREEGDANGLLIQEGRNQTVILRVNGSDTYLIDRWI